MFNLASALFSYEFCNIFSTEAFNQYVLHQLPYEPADSSSLLLKSLLLIVMFFGSGVLVFNKTKTQASTDEQKRKPPENHALESSIERKYSLARIISTNSQNQFESRLREPKAEGWHNRLPVPIDYPVDENHRNARRLAYEKHQKQQQQEEKHCRMNSLKQSAIQDQLKCFANQSRRLSFSDFEDFPKVHKDKKESSNSTFLSHLTFKI